jgi:hypothetical protein
VALRQDPQELAAAVGGALRRSDPNGISGGDYTAKDFRTWWPGPPT